MTQSVVVGDDFSASFATRTPQPLGTIPFIANGRGALVARERSVGARAQRRRDRLPGGCVSANSGAIPTDVELMMFAQANSEHCRHKIFNARWTIDGKPAPHSLFDMIRNTHRHINGAGILSAYSDNAAVIEGYHTDHWMVDPASHRYRYVAEPVHVLMKVETHNHPTAIAPYPGAATGSGGEIRDEGAVGRGSKPKAGLVGFTTSHLNIPGRPAAVGDRHRQAGADRFGAGHHAGRTDRRRCVQQRIRPARADGLFPHVRIRAGQRPCSGARLSQAGDDRGRHRQRAARARQRDTVRRRDAPHRNRRTGDADRPRRRRRVVDGVGAKQFRSRLRIGAARQRRDAAALSGSDRCVRGARRRESDPA